MQVIFIHHSCFLVEVDNKVLIFDYFDGNRVNGYTFHGKIPTYEPDTPIYMFASSIQTFIISCQRISGLVPIF